MPLPPQLPQQQPMIPNQPQMGQPPMGMAPMMNPEQVQQPTPAMEQGDSSEEDKLENYINFALSQTNLAKSLSKKKKGKETLKKMGEEIIEGYLEDENSRKEWLTASKEWINLAMLIRENKTYPWPKASNIKYPLLATAAMQFSARAYPALVPSSGNIVKTSILPQNPSDELYKAASRISNHMSYQVLERMPDWEEDMDKLLIYIAIVGGCWKKTYHNTLDKCHHSHMVYAENLCVNYYAKSIEKAYRKSEILTYNVNEVQEKINNDEEYLDVELAPPTEEQLKKDPVIVRLYPPKPDKSTPHVFIACHTYWDLDEDGYEEPYIITVNLLTKKVVRIIARWDMSGVSKNDEGKIIKIKPVEYFTTFPFIPNPDGSIYGLGFGSLLGPLNESANTLINQLVDSGTLNNLQSGFIGKGLRIKMGLSSFQPGEWKAVNATGDDLSKNIFPLPTKEPSGVLLSLLQMLITSGNQLASIAEIFVGKSPGQNTPATTTQEVVQQGMAVFTAIYKRIYRALKREYKKLYRLNKNSPDILAEESELSGIQLQQSDYDLPDWVIIPGADPIGDSTTIKIQKLQQVGQLISLGTINPQVFTEMVLEANEIPNYQKLILPPPKEQKPDPKMELAKMDMKKTEQEMQIAERELGIKERLASLEEESKRSKIKSEESLALLKQISASMEFQSKAQSRKMETRFDFTKKKMDLAHKKALFDQRQKETKEV